VPSCPLLRQRTCRARENPQQRRFHTLQQQSQRPRDAGRHALIQAPCKHDGLVRHGDGSRARAVVVVRGLQRRRVLRHSLLLRIVTVAQHANTVYRPTPAVPTSGPGRSGGVQWLAESMFRVGDAVEARRRGQWLAAVVEFVQRDGSMKVMFDDGDLEDDVPPEHVRRRSGRAGQEEGKLDRDAVATSKSGGASAATGALTESQARTILTRALRSSVKTGAALGKQLTNEFERNDRTGAGCVARLLQLLMP
jgi:hypothetical protein